MKNDYKNTLNLPKTLFSMKGNLIYKELDILNKWEKINIYSLIRKSKNKKKIFFLHDGPPYANGNIHIGHILNKVLKDIIIKYKGLSGYNAPFIPGWDCHGLPIELEVNKSIKENDIKEDFFKICRNYANNQINSQKEDFKRLGIFGDWDNSYLTMNYNTEANIILVLEKLFNLGYIKRYNKPTYWCIKCKSSISEFEIEHFDDICKSFYILYKVKNTDFLINKLNIKSIKNNKIFFISWTTTPWTIIDSKTISININIYYLIISINNMYYLLSKDSINNLIDKKIINNFIILTEIKGNYLLDINCFHPVTKEEISIVNNEKIESNIGTGIVNIAPGHSLIDYEIGLKNKLNVINNINEIGIYNNKHSISELVNIVKNILIDDNKLFFYEEYNYKYPHCSRHKYPIIFRSTYQWFIDLDHRNLRNKAIEYSQNVNWIPKWGKERIKNMLINRLDWCISRQRKWGVPITFFINKKCNSIHPKSNIFFKKIYNLIKKNGIESWWKLKIDKFLKNYNYKDYIKSEDILDVWFDSGTSFFSTIINQKKYKKIIQSDLYLEGHDQYRGWFISSLIIFTAIKNFSPYKNVLTHGFVLDNLNNKMSKSLKNVINPKNILQKYGSDIIRLWIAYSNYTKDIKISYENLERVSDIYKKIRNTIKYLLSNLYDFDAKKDLIKFNKLIEIDKWIINKLFFIQKNIINEYNNYNFHNVISILNNFCLEHLGSIYLDIIKDRQYTLHKNSYSRKSSQTAIYHILESLVRLISPILSFTSDEIWDFIPTKKSISVFTSEWYKELKCFNKNEFFNDNFWNLIFDIKKEINLIIEKKIIKKYIKNSLETKIILFLNKNIFNIIKKIKNELNFIFIVSLVSIINTDNNLNIDYSNTINTKINGLKIKVIKISSYPKCNRCWNYYKKNYLYVNNNICIRCILNINGIGKERKYA